MGMPVKLSDDLVEQAREEAKAADRSITSQIEHWARLGRSVESLLRHEEVVALKQTDRNAEVPLPAPTSRAILAALRRVASERPSELADTLMQGRTVYQDAGAGRIERIERDGSRSIGRIVNRRFVPDEPGRATRRK
jgi:ParD-like antitoxin of type II bacterial toxin-antitoxin system